MRSKNVSNAGATVVLFAVVAVGAAAEKKITRAELPAAVERTLATQSKGATIRGLATEVENGKTFYEAELTVNGHRRDILIDESGKVVEIEEEVALASLPVTVQDGLRKAAGSGEITRVADRAQGGTRTAT